MVLPEQSVSVSTSHRVVFHRRLGRRLPTSCEGWRLLAADHRALTYALSLNALSKVVEVPLRLGSIQVDLQLVLQLAVGEVGVRVFGLEDLFVEHSRASIFDLLYSKIAFSYFAQ